MNLNLNLIADLIKFDFLLKFSPRFRIAKLAFLIISLLLAGSEANILNCNYANTNEWLVGNRYSCHAQFVPAGNTRVVTAVSQNHLPGNTDASVLAFRLFRQDVGFAPLNIDAFFPNLISLLLDSIGIQEIPQNYFIGFPNLEVVVLGGNEIQVIDANTFDNNPLIHGMAWNSNPIRNIGRNVFDHLNALVTLQILDTICIDAWANSNRAAVELILLQIAVNCPPATAKI